MLGYPGQRVGSAHMARSMVNDAGLARQVDDLTVSTAVDSTAYTFTMNGVTVTFTSGTGTTKALIRTGLIEAYRANAYFEDVAAANPYSSDKVRFTSLSPGTAYTLAESDSNLTTTSVVSNVAKVWLPFGRAMVRRDGAVCQVSTLTIDTAANSTAYTFTLAGTAPDGTATGTQTFTITSDGTATKTEIRDALKLLVDVAVAAGGPLHGVLKVAAGTDLLTFTSLQAGVAFTLADADANMTSATGTASVAAGATGSKGVALPSTNGQALVGVLERIATNVDPSLASTGSPYGSAAPNQDVTVIYRGEVVVEVDEAVKAGETAYYRFASGTGTVLGQWRNDADTGTCERVDQAKFVSATSGAGLAVLSLNLP